VHAANDPEDRAQQLLDKATPDIEAAARDAFHAAGEAEVRAVHPVREVRDADDACPANAGHFSQDAFHVLHCL